MSASATSSGPDGKMFQTREGGTVKLADLLDEAFERAMRVIAGRPEEPSSWPARSRRREVARGGRHGRREVRRPVDRPGTRDYRFDWDRMLSFDGNTGPYLQYAHARSRSILRRATERGPAGRLAGAGRRGAGDRRSSRPASRRNEGCKAAPRLRGRGSGEHRAARAAQAVRLPLRFGSGFTDFYEHCPVLRAPDEACAGFASGAVRAQRTSARKGLDLLGIEAP